MRTLFLNLLILTGLLIPDATGIAQTLDSDSSGTVESPAPEHALSDTTSSNTPKLVLGWVENIRLMPGRELLKAKLDSGAKSSAIHAENIEFFRKDDKDMVRFTLLEDHKDPTSTHLQYELPVVREVSIKLRYTSVRDERPIVRLEFCLAGEIHNASFSLTNRADFNYPVLLGRNFLKQKILVDSEISFSHRTRCPPK